jgi:hypothetical protein
MMKILEITGIIIGIIYELSAFFFRSMLKFFHHIFSSIFTSGDKTNLHLPRGSAYEK